MWVLVCAWLPVYAWTTALTCNLTCLTICSCGVKEWRSGRVGGDQLIRCEVIEFCVVGMALDLVSLGFNLINGVESESGGICDKTQIKTLSVR